MKHPEETYASTRRACKPHTELNAGPPRCETTVVTTELRAAQIGFLILMVLNYLAFSSSSYGALQNLTHQK